MSNHRLRRSGQFHCFNFIFCKILEILTNRFDHNSSFLEVLHVYVGHHLTQSRVSFELNSSSLGSGKGMPYIDIQNFKEGAIMIETVQKNFENFTKKEI